MKTKVLAALVATMAVGATCAFAANPFVDVPTDSWAYKSVVELADAGIIQGVDGSYFQGDRNITRYEAAEMTAKAMAHMDKASVEQRALINKLADEYADELNSLGVRVSNLENKVGNVKLTGDARVRYRYQNGNDSRENDNSWDYRVRLRANAQVNDRTKVTYGLSSNSYSFGKDGAADADDNHTYTDLANIDYNFGGSNWDLLAGRYTYTIGGANVYGYQYGDAFDGVQLQYTNNHFRATAGYGKFKEGSTTETKHNGVVVPNYYKNAQSLLGVKTGYGELEGLWNKVAAGVYYNDFDYSQNGSYDDKGVWKETAGEHTADDLWGAYAKFNFGKDWTLLANYERVNDAWVTSTGKKDDADVWIGKLQYGKASFAAPKSWDAWVEYINADEGAYVGGSNGAWRFNDYDNIKSWGVGIDYTFAKNAMFSVMQSFASDYKNDKDMKDPEEMTRADFVFVF